MVRIRKPTLIFEGPRLAAGLGEPSLHLLVSESPAYICWSRRAQSTFAGLGEPSLHLLVSVATLRQRHRQVRPCERPLGWGC